MKKEAKFWEKLADKKVQCHLCPHNCKINDGKTGICNVRKNEDGKLYTLIYGSCSSIASDPIEKKPLYHFYPGTDAFSLGTVGCNFKCEHCQNYTISTATPDVFFIKNIMPEEAVSLAKQHGCRGIAWTYNEPTIWHEYSYDSMVLTKKQGLYTVYVTNGYINEEPLKELSKYLDAMNIDVKAFTEEFYKKICKAKLQPVLQTCELSKKLEIYIELTYLVIPGYNDSIDEIKKFCNWVVEKLGDDTPVHFSRFHPDNRLLGVPMTPMHTLQKIFNVAKESGILYPYLGNVPHGDYENTYCPSCGNLCVERLGYSTNICGLKDGKCLKCNNPIPMIIDNYKKQKI
ncbi:MAG: AmmeMemoRadiSam system radical SAM enzyme [Candidatus Thermoplasmatota archaeon]|jgi:pyruvate formate lyase activating enzyme|nr:AmmeMemoRadiSam system radical SAM enzyme [Candidatus Thermoplasmatota archaeon]